MEHIIYTKYSDDRAPEYQIRTDIVIDDIGKKKIRKKALFSCGKKHIQNHKKIYEQLNEIYSKENEVLINKCKITEQGLEVEYVEGKTLEDLLDKCLSKDDIIGFTGIFSRFLEIVNMQCKDKMFVLTERFKEIFGEIEFSYEQKAAEFCDIDMIFENFICKDNGEWVIIDYEWTFECLIPIKFVVFRSLFYYFNKIKGINKCDYKYFMEIASISEDEWQIFERMEKNFQKFIMHNSVTMHEIRDLIGNKLYNVGDLIEKTILQKEQSKIQIYFDYGIGFTEVNSWIFEPEKEFDGKVEIKIILDKRVKRIRVDPAVVSCIVSDLEVLSPANLKPEETNGFCISDKIIIFENDDPQIFYDLPKDEEIFLISFKVDLFFEGGKTAISDIKDILFNKESAYNRLEESKKNLHEQNIIICSQYAELQNEFKKLSDEYKEVLKIKNIEFMEITRLEQLNSDLVNKCIRLENEINGIKKTKVWNFYQKIRKE